MTMWNFHGSWFLTLEFPMGVTQICRLGDSRHAVSRSIEERAYENTRGQSISR